MDRTLAPRFFLVCHNVNHQRRRALVRIMDRARTDWQGISSGRHIYKIPRRVCEGTEFRRALAFHLFLSSIKSYPSFLKKPRSSFYRVRKVTVTIQVAYYLAKFSLTQLKATPTRRTILRGRKESNVISNCLVSPIIGALLSLYTVTSQKRGVTDSG